MAHEALVKEGEQALKKNVKPEEVKDFFVKKGMDEKEAETAIRDTTKKQHIPYEGKKSSFWAVFFILLVLIAVAVLFLQFSGIVTLF